MDRLLTPEEVCQRYSIKKNTLYQWTSKNLIPYLKRGGLRFKADELEKWESGEVSNIKLI
ncbi:MAG: hypothetical protein COV71_02105 [Candidatus Omnitrophica bacterium CG11_big_fil_rev_8_21_14_0_20_41_12]|nr:MAG: hypothetical protein COV71_02105 [Candidatus Omnitrophica bacterium CG11_big_fil_rev_8_21_14_0_20_41_12]